MAGDTYAIIALRRKRAHLAGEIEAAQRALMKQRHALSMLDAVLNIFEPATNPELIPPIRPVKRGLFAEPRRHLSRLVRPLPTVLRMSPVQRHPRCPACRPGPDRNRPYQTPPVRHQMPAASALVLNWVESY